MLQSYHGPNIPYTILSCVNGLSTRIFTPFISYYHKAKSAVGSRNLLLKSTKYEYYIFVMVPYRTLFQGPSLRETSAATTSQVRGSVILLVLVVSSQM